jgi:CHAT domain-containing protein
VSGRAKVPRLDAKLLARLCQLEDAAARRKFLNQNPPFLRAKTVEALAVAVREQIRIDPQHALNLAEFTILAAQKLRKPELQALSLRAKANALYSLGQNQEAVELHERVAKLFEKCGDTVEVARTMSASIQPLILLGEYDRAMAAAERARAIFSQLGDAHRLARLEINVGNIYHRQDRFAEALACYERAYENLSPFQDFEGIAAVLSNLAVCLISLNDFHRALATYARARQFCEQHGMPVLTAQADYNIAYLYYLRGEYGRAIEMLKAARETCRKFDDAYHFALCHLDLSEIYLELNFVAEAEEIASEGYLRFHKLGMKYEEAKCLANKAIAISQLGKPFRGLEFFDEARAIFVREQNRVWPWLIDLYKALILLREDRLYEAKRLCARALEFFGSSGLRGKEILCRFLLARLALRAGDLPAARKECKTALERLREAEMPALDQQANFLMGQIEQAAGDRARAFEFYRAARESLESLRGSLQGEELKISFLKDKLQVYENLVELCLEDETRPGSSEEAFETMEEAKSRSLRDLILRSGTTPAVGESGQSELVRRIRDLREELNWYYHRIELEQLRQQEAAPSHIERLQDQAIHKEKELLGILREMPASEAAWHTFQTSPRQSIEEIRRSLAPDSMIVEYFSIGDRMVAAVLTRETLQITAVTLVRRVREQLQMLQFQLAKHQLQSDYVLTFEKSLLEATQSHLHELYKELVAPIRMQCKGRHLVIVPHGILHYLPFHALYDGERYLIDDYTISYAPSASIYSLCHTRKVNREGPSLIFGVPDEQAPYISDEVQSLAKILPASELFLGKEATLSNLRERGPQARLLHIATHGDFRQDNPMFSRIRLGDSYLALYDLYGLRLPAEMIALSGCATGMNLVAAGDELLGLIRGLLGAGAQSLLLSLWDVHDQSTAEFMKTFYRSLSESKNKAEAYQAAARKLRRQSPHPYYWAPFILVGHEGAS